MVGQHNARLLRRSLLIPGSYDGAVPRVGGPLELGRYRPVASSFDLAGMRGIHKHDRSGGSLHPHPSPAELGPPEATLHVSEQAGTSHVLNARFGSRTLRGLLRS